MLGFKIIIPKKMARWVRGLQDEFPPNLPIPMNPYHRME
jgi:hypothetical protein